jgi:AAA domain-containing protein
MPDLKLRPAVRKAAPLLISVSSVSGGGKTYTSLLLAAGLAGPDGKVGMLDTENGRGEMYADSPGIMAALPNGFSYLALDPPFTPARYTEHLKALEAAGMRVAVVDSGTHEWEGTGGCSEMAENNKLGGMDNWSLAKREHKKFLNFLLSTKMHVIICLRARDKVKIVNKQVIPLGILPITEKNFVFEMLLSLALDETTHHATAIKIPEGLQGIFDKPRMLTKADGELIAKWNDGGSKKHEAEEALRRLQIRATEAMDNGLVAYEKFFKELTKQERLMLEPFHQGYKQQAEEADKLLATREAGSAG